MESLSSLSVSLVPVSNGAPTTDKSNSSPSKEKDWERPWSIKELRDGSRNWSLASDAGVIKIR